ncbi:DsbA family oxidoreductase [Pseudobacillus wudalianchiensis]|uniref:Disulfide bond formation protein DsbA n=1 Tax=Pseudobacillus wudalianchiensis TaxID=1743143 RepID=A0A1B9ATB3_9BACI|nr:DsbA family oxidoreductase [Bacillus wudalianchiensis]OCA87122.1 disulfide bond formation protein DsbA [Bacillus wudalianchiensis]
MEISIWSDFVCPFCYIGKRRLEEALDKFPYKEKVTIRFKSFELAPDAPKETSKTIHEALAEKYGMSIQQAKAANANVAEQAKTVGLTFNFENMKPANTLDAHRLAKFAVEKGKGAELTERLLKAYFTDSLPISDADTLTEIAGTVGLNKEEVRSFLKENRLTEEVRADEAEARQIGVQGVPFFVFNNKYAVSGAQPVEAFAAALQKVWEEENDGPVVKILSEGDKNEAVCTDESCDLSPEK